MPPMSNVELLKEIEKIVEANIESKFSERFERFDSMANELAAVKASNARLENENKTLQQQLSEALERTSNVSDDDSLLY